MLAEDNITKVIHELGFMWHCTVCGYSNAHKNNTKKHFARKHGENGHFPCPVKSCQKQRKVLTNKFDFNTHLYSAHPDLVQEYRIPT